MNQRKNTTAFLKECMADALFGLLRNYPLGKLSVQKITDTAGVSRITWFRSFSSKQEALTYKILRPLGALGRQSWHSPKSELYHPKRQRLFSFQLRNPVHSYDSIFRQSAIRPL